MACEPCEDATTADAAILAAMTGPAKVTTDGVTVEQHKLSELIAAANHVASKCSASNSRRGIRFTQLVPPGTV